MFITQVTSGGQKIKKGIKLPRIDSARGVESITQSSQSTELLLAGKQMAEVQAQLDQKKVEFQERKSRCEELEARIAAGQKWLKNEDIKFQAITKESEAKRVREVKKAQEATAVWQAKEREAVGLREQIDALHAEMEEKKQRLEGGLLYQGFLERVVENSTEFVEIPDILKRHETLVATNSDLQATVQSNSEETERLRITLHQVTKQRQNEVLVRSSQIASLQQLLEKAMVETAEMESAKERVEDEVKERMAELGRAKMCLMNLYNRCRATHTSDSKPKQDTREDTALRYIEERLRDLQSIVDKAGSPAGPAPVKSAQPAREAPGPPAGGAVDRQASLGAAGRTQ